MDNTIERDLSEFGFDFLQYVKFRTLVEAANCAMKQTTGMKAAIEIEKMADTIKGMTQHE